MDGLLDWIRRVAGRLAAWLQGVSSSPEVKESGPAEEEPEQEESLRVVAGDLGIFVHCASCGIYHELSAVCHVCGAPLCTDEENCRLFGKDEDMDQVAVYCQSCYPGVPYS